MKAYERDPGAELNGRYCRGALWGSDWRLRSAWKSEKCFRSSRKLSTRTPRKGWARLLVFEAGPRAEPRVPSEGLPREKVGNGGTHIPPGGDKCVWIANNELVTHKVKGKNAGGQFALVEVVGPPGSGAPPPPTPENLRRMLEVGRKYGTEYPPLPTW